MKKRSIKGFTLIEVLLGLIIFAIIGLSTYNMFWMGMKVDHKANDINRSYVQLRSAFELIAKDLENTFVYDFSSSYPKEISFQGQPDQMTFVLPTQEGIRSVHYYLNLPDWGRVTKTIIKQYVQEESIEPPIHFLMRQDLSLPEHLSKKERLPEGEIILVSVMKDGLKLSYGALEKDSKNQGGPKRMVWKDTWEDNTLPNAVRVQITLYDHSNPRTGVVFQREIYLPMVSALK